MKDKLISASIIALVILVGLYALRKAGLSEQLNLA